MARRRSTTELLPLGADFTAFFRFSQASITRKGLVTTRRRLSDSIQTKLYPRRNRELSRVVYLWCRGGDLNSHGLAPTTPSRWRVCLFHHLGLNNPAVWLLRKALSQVSPLEKRGIAGAISAALITPLAPLILRGAIWEAFTFQWQGRQDSNPRPAVLETAALAKLSYAPQPAQLYQKYPWGDSNARHAV